MDAHLTGLVAALAVLAAASVFGIWRRETDGVARATTSAGADPLTASELGGELGGRVTFVQFSSPVCRPCEATRRILSTAASAAEGVVHIEFDAETRLDLVKRFNVLRTPTVLVLDPDGRVAQRISGAPKPTAIQALLASA
jgi:thiol-disulfide isomerase/thioredoxin